LFPIFTNECHKNEKRKKIYIYNEEKSTKKRRKIPFIIRKNTPEKKTIPPHLSTFIFD